MGDGKESERQLTAEERKRRISEGMKKFHAKKKAKPRLNQTKAGLLEELRREREELDNVIAYLERRG